jgi:hypothetical protein
MPRVKMVIEDDDVQVFVIREVELEVKSGSFHDVEGAVDELRRVELPRLERDLLLREQARVWSKKGGSNSKGRRVVRLHSIHGTYTFPHQRFLDSASGTGTTFLELTGEMVNNPTRRRGHHRWSEVRPCPPGLGLRVGSGNHPGLVPPHQEAAGAPEPNLPRKRRLT